MSPDRPFPPRPADESVPAPGSFTDAWRAGRTRRRHKLVTSGGASAALGAVVLVGAAVLTSGAGGGDSLRQLPPAGGGGNILTPPSPGGGGTVLTPPPLPSAGPVLPERVGPTSLPNLPRLPGTGASPAPQASASPTGETTPEREEGASYAGSPSRPVDRTYESSSPQAGPDGTSGGGQTVCGLDVADRPSGTQARWCGGGEVDPAGRDFALGHRQCRAQDGDQPALTFRTTQEVEWEIRTASGRLLWRWSDGYDVQPAPHELPTEPGACYTWKTSWTPLGADGDPLPPGDYVLRTWVTSAELGAAAAYDTTFTIDDPEGN